MVIAGPGGVRAVSGRAPAGGGDGGCDHWPGRLRRRPATARRPAPARTGVARRPRAGRAPAHASAAAAQEEASLRAADQQGGRARCEAAVASSGGDASSLAASRAREWDDRYPRTMTGEAAATQVTGTAPADGAWLRALVREIPDYPPPGVTFRDITPLLADPVGFRRCVDELADRFADTEVDCVVGVESRGFILAAPIAYRLGAGVRAGAQGRQAAVGGRPRGVRARVRPRQARDPPRRDPSRRADAGDRRRAGHRRHRGGHRPPDRGARRGHRRHRAA